MERERERKRLNYKNKNPLWVSLVLGV